jgi:hypothetical protein
VTRSVRREPVLRAAAVVAITASITLAAACSDEDVVDTIPPPRPQHTLTGDGPEVGPPSTTGTSTAKPSTTKPSTAT